MKTGFRFRKTSRVNLNNQIVYIYNKKHSDNLQQALFEKCETV